MFKAVSRGVSLAFLTIAAVLATMGSTGAATAADKSVHFEETAAAFWAVPYSCADGSTVEATLLLQTTRDFESPDTEDPDPSARVQYQAVCPDGTSYTWIGFLPATITSSSNLKRVSATGSGVVTDIFGKRHRVTFDATWTADGPVKTTVNGPGSTRKQRNATATGVVTFDGDVLVNGDANHPTRPAPFIRIDIEK